MEGHIYIEGQIGSSKNEDGVVTHRGVELQDVISQVQALKGMPTIFCHIDSEGGFVRTGKKIAEYIQSLPNITTIADGKCASIATIIHLAPPVERRKIVEGTDYHIHPPMFKFQREVSMNQDELLEASEDIGETEKELLAVYVKSTTLDKNALSPLMKQGTSLTAAQCKEFGFVSEILPAKATRAVALLQPKQKTNTNDMSKFIDELKALSTLVKTALAGKVEKVSLDATTKDGFKIVIDTTEEAPKVGDKVMDENGKSLDPGKYETQWGTLVVVDGSIAEIIPAMAAANPELEALQAELTALKAEREAEQAEIASLKKDVEAMAKLTSTYKPAAEKVAFRKEAKEEKTVVKSIKDAYKEKKAASQK